MEAAAQVAAVEAVARVDGRLSDATWASAAVLSTFEQAAPQAGAPPSARTELRLASDGRLLYVAFIALHALHARDADAVIEPTARTLRRDDEAIDSDDHVTLVLDPQGTQRHGFLFRVNTLGARRDALVFDGAQLGFEWDATWQAQARIDADGWRVEMAIPLALLGAPAGGAPLRFNAERYVAATGERMRLHGAVAERGVESLPDAAPLEGINVQRSGWGLRLRPALRWQRTALGSGAVQQSLEPALDATWQARPGITVAAALNVDFADAAPDDREVNLSRFERYRPDKRLFFTQDSGRFAFGGLEGDEPNLLAFFSRRVALERTLDAGLKVSGTAGAVDFGVLAAQVERVRDGRDGPGEDSAADARTPRALVMRAALPVGQEQRIGAIATQGSPDGAGGSGLVGIDHRWRTDALFSERVLETALWAMQSRNAGLGAGRAQGLQLNYPNLGWNGSLAWQRIDERFLPALGYVEEAGIERINAEWGWWQRRADGGDWRPRVYAGQRRRLDGSERSHYLGPALEWTSAVGDLVFVEAYTERERIAEAFEPLPGVVVAAGDYRFASAALNVETSATRALSAETSLRGGGWYGGQLAEQSLKLTWRPNAHWALGGGASRQSARVGGARFVARTASLLLEHAGSAHSAQSLVLQYDNVSRQTFAGVRARWEMSPGTEWRLSLDRAQPVRASDERRSRASLVFVSEWTR